MRRIALILLAGGSSSRFGHAVPKQFLPTPSGLPLAHYVLKTLGSFYSFDETVVVVDSTKHSSFAYPCALPGNSWIASLNNGLEKLSSSIDLVLVHDGARPFVIKEDVDNLLNGLGDYHAISLGAPCRNTLKKVNTSFEVVATIDRTQLFEIYTPQLFVRSSFIEAFSNDNFHDTDSLMVLEKKGLAVRVIQSSSTNIKITFKGDERLLALLK